MIELRVLFVLSSLRCGGAQRVVLRLLAHLPRRDFDLHLAVFDKTGPFLSQIPGHVDVHDLKIKRVSRSFEPLLRTIWRLRPDVVVSSMFHTNAAAALLKPLMPPSTRLVIRETAVSGQLLVPGMLKVINMGLAPICFRLADRVICQSDFMREDLGRNLSLPWHKAVVVRNPVDFDEIRRLAAAEGNPFGPENPGPNVVAVTRFDAFKGIDRLIDAFPALLQRRGDAMLWLLGQGSQQKELEDRAVGLGIRARVRFCGYQKNPFRWLRHADLFVLPSRSESAPNALLETAACGCPAVVLDHPGGTREMMDLLGQSWRIVTSLVPWNPAWFTRPDPRVAEKAEKCFGISEVISQYAAILRGPGSAARRREAA